MTMGVCGIEDRAFRLARGSGVGDARQRSKSPKDLPHPTIDGEWGKTARSASTPPT